MLQVHYIPSWNGDWRLTADRCEPEKRTDLTVTRPTSDEKQQLRQMLVAFNERGWLKDGDEHAKWPAVRTRQLVINAPLSEVGPVVVAIAKPGRNVLTLMPPLVVTSDALDSVVDALEQSLRGD